MPWNVEVTDTFGGELNYCWVRRYTVPDNGKASRAAVVRRVKAAAGYSGIRGRTDWFGDYLDFRPRGECVAVTAAWVEE